MKGGRISNTELLAAGGAMAGAAFLGSALAGGWGALCGALAALAVAALCRHRPTGG